VKDESKKKGGGRGVEGGEGGRQKKQVLLTGLS